MLAPDRSPGFLRPPGLRAARRGFTLVELLVVIAILGTLVALLLPAVQAAREAARRQTCSSHLRQVALAISNYESAMRYFPPGRIGCDDTPDVSVCPAGMPVEKKTAASGLIAILPYMEQQALYTKLGVNDGGLWNRNISDLGWWTSSPVKAEAVKQRVELFVCPSDNSDPISAVYTPVLAATGSYAFVQGTKGPGTLASRVARYESDGMFLYVIQRRSNEITDGRSNTMMLGEVIDSDVWQSTNTWTYARQNSDCLRTTEFALNTPSGYTPEGSLFALELQNGAFGSEHPGGAMFVYADGHVAMMQNDIDITAYRDLSTIAGD